MSAAEAIKAARAAGIEICVDGADLVVEASAPPAPALLDALSRHKVAILALLQPSQHGWTAANWRRYLDKWRGIAERSDGLPHAEAEARAFTCCVIEWLNQHPTPTAPGLCSWCSKPESPSAVVLPFGTEPGTHAWLHAECWCDWHRARRAEAIAALAIMGIEQDRPARDSHDR